MLSTHDFVMRWTVFKRNDEARFELHEKLGVNWVCAIKV
jgi:hypothetical protein